MPLGHRTLGGGPSTGVKLINKIRRIKSSASGTSRPAPMTPEQERQQWQERLLRDPTCPPNLMHAQAVMRLGCQRFGLKTITAAINSTAHMINAAGSINAVPYWTS